MKQIFNRDNESNFRIPIFHVLCGIGVTITKYMLYRNIGIFLCINSWCTYWSYKCKNDFTLTLFLALIVCIPSKRRTHHFHQVYCHCSSWIWTVKVFVKLTYIYLPQSISLLQVHARILVIRVKFPLKKIDAAFL